MAVRIESQAEPIPGYRLIERLGGAASARSGRPRPPAACFKAIKFVYGDLDSAGGDAERAEQELKALSRVKTRPPSLHPVPRTLRHHRRPAHHRHGAGRPQPLGPLQGVPRPGAARHPARRAARLPGGDGRGARPDERRTTSCSTSTSSRRTSSWSTTTSRSPTSAWSRTWKAWPASVTGGVTPVYAAPETFDGWVSRFSDQYSLAIVYQELLTGHAAVRRHQRPPADPAAPPGRRRTWRRCRPADRPIIARALAKKPDDRHPTCADMVARPARAGAVAVGRRGEPAETGLLRSGARGRRPTPPPPDARWHARGAPRRARTPATAMSAPPRR